MNNTQIFLLVEAIVSSLLLVLCAMLLVLIIKRKKASTLNIKDTNKNRFVYLFFTRWLAVFIIFALTLAALFCWVNFGQELAK